MKRCLFATAIFLAPHFAVASDLYKLSNVKRLESNLYRADGGLVISTRMCLHLTIGEDAVLKWESSYSMDNKIIWDDGETCQVAKIMSTR